VKPKKWVYFLSKFTLIDELLGLLYWGIAIYGVFFIMENIKTQTVLIITLCIYIISIVLIYIVLLKKAKTYFKGNTGK